MPLSVRCGGHGIAGTSVVEDGVLVDLSSMKGVHVDVERGTAIAQAGVLWGEYDRETELFGRATPGGRVTTTGVGGFCLGGGYGWASAAYGLTCDNLVARPTWSPPTGGWCGPARTRTPTCCGA